MRRLVGTAGRSSKTQQSSGGRKRCHNGAMRRLVGAAGRSNKTQQSSGGRKRATTHPRHAALTSASELRCSASCSRNSASNPSASSISQLGSMEKNEQIT